jgi:antitoxin component YwqK of YwqJK toxin-antitoxin module
LAAEQGHKLAIEQVAKIEEPVPLNNSLDLDPPLIENLPAVDSNELIADFSQKKETNSTVKIPDDLLISQSPISADLIKVTGGSSFDHDSLLKFIKENSVFIGAFWTANAGVKDKLGFLCQVLSDDILEQFQYRGFLDVNVKFTTENREGEQGLLIEIEEGEQFKFLGYEVDQDIPEWLATHLNTFLGRDANGITESIKKISAYQFSMDFGENFSTSKQRWFGQTDLLSPSKQNIILDPEESGFSSKYDTLSAQKFLSDDLVFLSRNSSFSYPLLWQSEESIKVLIECIAARKGFPGVKFEFKEVREPDGFRLSASLSRFDIPLRFSGIQLSGLTEHEPDVVKDWIIRNHNLVNGKTLITTSLLKKIQTSLLESCCFYDVGVHPLSLIGNSPLIITLRDHENLPKLNHEFSKTQKVLREVAIFLSRNPDFHLSKNFNNDSSIGVGRVTASYEQLNDRLSLEVQSDSGKSMAEIALDQNFLSVILADPISFAARKPASLNMTAFGGLTVQDSNNGRMRYLSFGLSLRTISTFGARVNTFFTPSVLLLQDGKYDIELIADNESEQVLKNDSLSARVINDEQGIFKIEITTLDLPRFSLLFTRNRSLVAEGDWDGEDDFSLKNVLSFLAPVLGQVHSVPNSGKDLGSFILNEILIPKLTNLLGSTIFQTEQKSPSLSPILVNQKGKYSLVGNVFNDSTGVIDASAGLKEGIRTGLGWQTDRWPTLLMEAAISGLMEGNSKKLFEILNSVLKSDRVGPLGNISFALFCDGFVSKKLAVQFFRKAKDSNLFMLFMDDLGALNLSGDLTVLIAELLANKELLEDLLGVSKIHQTDELFTQWIENLRKIGDGDPVNDLMAKMYRIYLREEIVKFIEGENLNEWEFGLNSSGSRPPQKRVIEDGEHELFYPEGSKRAENNFKNGVLHGLCKGWYPSGQKEYEREWVDGKIMNSQKWLPNGQLCLLTDLSDGDGIIVSYFANGKKSSVEVFKSGMLNGQVINYYESGIVSSKTNYKDQLRHGQEILYHENGRVRQDANYTEDQLHGESRVYFENGNLATVENFKDGEKDGLDVDYKSDGTKSVEANYSNNLKNGREVLYYENGRVRQDANYSEDQLHGESRVYFENGELATVEYYKKGRKNGRDVDYTVNGSKTSDVNYWRGLKHGQELLYFENGQIHEQLSYLFGQRNGGSKTFYASGSKKSETFYLDGIKHGISTSYGEDGTEKLEVYDQGTNILE